MSIKGNHGLRPDSIAKALTGISGLDEITLGGFPAGRPTLVCGGPGCGKTVLAMEFLVRGTIQYNEPGLFVSFEEAPAQIVENFRSLAFDLEDLAEGKRLKISHVDLSRGELFPAGDFSLDGLFVMLEHGAAETGAKRIVLDTIETIFAALPNTERLRHEISRLFQWLRNKGITAIVTAERGRGEDLTRLGLEEYISDCVILLDHRVNEQVSKRRLRIVKYRGSAHATNEFPFLIGDTGFSVLPITSLSLDYAASDRRVSSGIDGLDGMLGGDGYFAASVALVSGTSGTGKSTLAAAFALAACRRGERCLYFAFEESLHQLTRNMKSVGIDWSPWLENGLLTVHSSRPTFYGLEEHLITVTREAAKINPSCVVIDPITNFVGVGDVAEVKSMLIRTLDLLKLQGITLVMTSLSKHAVRLEDANMQMSSVVDTWIALDFVRVGNDRRRTINIVKARGMEHSQEIRELVMSSRGLSLEGMETEPTHE